MRSQLAFTMDSMYGRDGTSAYPCGIVAKKNILSFL